MGRIRSDREGDCASTATGGPCTGDASVVVTIRPTVEPRLEHPGCRELLQSGGWRVPIGVIGIGRLQRYVAGALECVAKALVLLHVDLPAG